MDGQLYKLAVFLRRNLSNYCPGNSAFPYGYPREMRNDENRDRVRIYMLIKFSAYIDCMREDEIYE